MRFMEMHDLVFLFILFCIDLPNIFHFFVHPLLANNISIHFNMIAKRMFRKSTLGYRLR